MGLTDAAQDDLNEVMAHYEAAFRDVQARIASLELGRVPAWVFAIDGMPLTEVGFLDRHLAVLERRRRQWRTALQSITELMALGCYESPPESIPDGAPEGAYLPELDRFITVIEAAGKGGCFYLNGTVRPVEARGMEPIPEPIVPVVQDKATFEIPPPRVKGPKGS